MTHRNKNRNEDADLNDPELTEAELAECRIDQEALNVILSILRNGGTRAAALRHAGISPKTLIKWYKKSPQVLAMVEQAEGSYQAGLEVKLSQVARTGKNIEKNEDGTEQRYAATPAQVKALTFILERRFHTDWRERKEVDVVNSTDGEDIIEALERKFDEAVGGRFETPMAKEFDENRGAGIADRLAELGQRKSNP